MFRFFFSLLFLQLYIFQVLGNATAGCNQKEISASFLDVAVDMINKAKSYIPVCPTISQNGFFKPIDCEELFRSGQKASGVYTIWLRNWNLEDRSLEVFCDMDTDGGGWTVIQRRGNFGKPIDYFYKDWSSYREGFGNIKEDFWLGNDNIHTLTNERLYSIRFDLKAIDGEKRYALYDVFWIEDESNKYRLHISGYSGDAGDSMVALHHNQSFATKDRNDDNGCAVKYKGAWWYKSCYHSNLNGLYHKGEHGDASGVNWNTFKGQNEALDTTEMKIRPKNFRK